MRLSSWQLCAPAAPTSLAPSVGSSGLGVSVSGHLGREGGQLPLQKSCLIAYSPCAGGLIPIVPFSSYQPLCWGWDHLHSSAEETPD